MKYLKPFNEAVTQDDIELCCVDLFDDGFELNGYNKTGKTIIQLVKNITSSLPDDQSNIVVVDEHSKNYRQGTITISGRNFDHVITKERSSDLPFTENENKLISQVSDAANLLRHYNNNGSDYTLGGFDRVVITIVNRGLQNPYNFQYERYITQINILFYL
jgi:hypothetical protein